MRLASAGWWRGAPSEIELRNFQTVKSFDEYWKALSLLANQAAAFGMLTPPHGEHSNVPHAYYI